MARNTTFSGERPCISCKLLRETEKAFLIEYEGEEFWIPKSQSEIYKSENGHDLFCEEWLLKEKGIL